MEIISFVKLGYKNMMLNNLLGIFNEEAGYDMSEHIRKHQVRGCKGLDFSGRKSTVSNMINVLNIIWSIENKYSKVENIEN